MEYIEYIEFPIKAKMYMKGALRFFVFVLVDRVEYGLSDLVKIHI